MTHFSFILVEPAEPGNLGAAARAMHTMGFSDLRLVRPKADPLSGIARALAHRCEHILEAAPIYEDLTAALADSDLACATTARHRIERYHYVSGRELPRAITAKGDWVKRVALVFGSERSGLSNQDLQHCDLLTTLPQACSQPSLNLAQAIMLYSFILAEHLDRDPSEGAFGVQIKDQRLNSRSMPAAQYGALKNSLDQLAQRVGLPERYQGYLKRAIARLSYEDLYLIHNIRTFIDNKLTDLEKQIDTKSVINSKQSDQ